MKKVVLLFITTILLLSCSDDDEKEKTWNEINIPVPTMSKMVMTEVEETYMTTSSTAINTIKNEYAYTDNKLTSYTNTQSVSIGDEIVQKLFHQVTLQYENNLVTVIDSEDNKWIYTLNEQGYATQCTYTTISQVRQYNFTYTDGYLTQLHENITSINDTLQPENASHTLSLVYQYGELISVTSPSLTNESFTDYGENKIMYEAGETINYYRLPCLDLLETYPLSFHQCALFAGILGKPTQHLVARSTPENNNNEYTTYSYTFDNEGKPTSIYRRTHYSNKINIQNILIAIE